MKLTDKELREKRAKLLIKRLIRYHGEEKASRIINEGKDQYLKDILAKQMVSP